MNARRSASLERLATYGLFLAVGLWTLLTALVPGLAFSVFLPRTRLAIEVSGAVVSVITIALAYLRYSLTGARPWHWIALAFVPIAFNQTIFGVIIPVERIGVRPALYFWTAGRIISAVLLLLGARRGRIAGQPVHAARSFLARAGAVAASLAAVNGVLWVLRRSLPPLSKVPGSIDPATISGPLPGLSPAVIGMELAGTVLLLAAALLYLRRDEATTAPRWLPPALVFAAFSHVHYMLFPTVFSDYISTGDLLRLAFSAALLAGVTFEVRRIFLLERAHARELSRAFATERVRVQELEEIDRARAELYGVMTHELLHPVAALRALALILSQQADRLSPDVRNQTIANIERETARLGALAQGVSAAIQFGTEAFALARRPETVADLVRDAVDATGELGGRLRISLEDGAAGVVVDADRVRLLQVFRNLVSNAEKYSPEDSPVDLEVRASDDEVSFHVADRGPGVLPEDLPQLFRAFARIRRPGEERIPGSGLGLYICRHIVDAHGGRIWVENRPGGGAVFAFALPRAERGSGDGSDQRPGGR